MDILIYISSFRCFLMLNITNWLAIFFLFAPINAYSQILLEPGMYRSNVGGAGGIGDWDSPASWEIWDGVGWVAALEPPARDNDVFILQNHELRLTQNQEVGNLYLYSAASPGRKLNLQTFDLDVYGALRGLDVVGGVMELYSATSPIADWIYPEMGSIVFKGTSRTIVDRSSWSAQSTNSRYTVRFDPEPDATLVVNSPFKANAFIIESGTVLQTVNTNGTPATSTFSFNIHGSFGDEEYGTFIVRAGARLISEGTAEYGQIVRRTENRPASEFILEAGAYLEFLGERPIIDAALVQLDGHVRYSSMAGQQYLADKSMAASQEITAYHHLSFSGNASKQLSDELSISGDVYVSDGAVAGENSTLLLTGNEDQAINWPEMTVLDLEINKPDGILSLRNNLEVIRDFSMTRGNVDFHNNSLTINSSFWGNYHYDDGNWLNLGSFTYANLPSELNQHNGTFAYFDAHLNEPRKLRLAATSVSSGQSLTVTYHQHPGVSWATSLTDHDGEDIVYYLNSHFAFNVKDATSDNLQVWIQGDDMILNNLEDLRLAGNGTVAVGTHLGTTWEGGNLWARRQLAMDDLHQNSLTLASTHELSILPLEWEELSAIQTKQETIVSWKTKANENTIFIIYRSDNELLDFYPVGQLAGWDMEDQSGVFAFYDNAVLQINLNTYYQIAIVDENGTRSKSPVFKTIQNGHVDFLPKIYPNPYHSGALIIDLPVSVNSFNMSVYDGQGRIILDGEMAYRNQLLRTGEKLTRLPKGIYFFHFSDGQKSYFTRWAKEN